MSIISPTERFGQRYTSPGTYAIFLWISIESFQTSLPKIFAEPPLALIIPSKARMVVDLPAPWSKITQNFSFVDIESYIFKCLKFTKLLLKSFYFNYLSHNIFLQ